MIALHSKKSASKRLLFSLSTLIFFIMSACANYQYITISSDLNKNSSQEIVFENDSLTIKYFFNGQNCPVTFLVTNHLEIPMYIDWSKSSAILNGESISYFNDKTTINASSAGTEFQWTEFLSTQNTNTQGTLKRSSSISFIPPNASIRFNPIMLKDEFLELDQTGPVQTLNMPIENGKKRVKRYTYDKTTTPFKFRSFMTYSTVPDFAFLRHVDHQFWVDGVVQTNVHPNVYLYQPTNQFYLADKKDGGVANVIGVAALVGVAVILEKEK